MSAATARTASRVPASPRLRHAVEIAETILVAVFVAAVVTILLRARTPEPSDLDLAQLPAAAAARA